MSKPKRHHYLPEFYLHGFCRDGFLWIRDCSEQLTRKQTPKNTAVISHCYSIETDHGPHTGIEEMLSNIEGVAKPIIDRITERQTISHEDKEALSFYLALLWNRTPDFQRSIEKIESHLLKSYSTNMFRNIEDAKRSLAEYEADTGERLEISAEKLYEFMSKGEYEIKISRSESLRMMLALSPKWATYFRQMDWVVAHSPPMTSFITTDNPLIVTPPRDHKPSFWHSYGALTPGAAKVVPLTQSVCLFMLDHGAETIHRDLNRSNVRSVNRTLASHVNRYLIGRDELLVNSVASVGDEACRTRDGRITIS
jgi:hypothetical protein